jgi:outer membrane receptor protein involved in Fe transport
VAAALFAASALAAAGVRAQGPGSERASWRSLERPGALAALLGPSWASLEIASVVPAVPSMPGSEAAPRLAIAGATLRDGSGWSASLFVSHAIADRDAEPLRLSDSTAVNARLARRIGRGTTLTLDVFNVLDRRDPGLDAFVAASRWSAGGMPEDYLVHPGEPRGVRLGIRKTFR